MWMRLLAAILALALLAVAGCGGDDQAEQYVEDFNEVQTSFEQNAGDLDDIDATTPEGQAALEQFAAAAEDAATEVRELDAPEDVTEQNAELVAVFEEIRDVTREMLDILSGDLDERDAAALSELGDHVAQAGQRADALTEEIAEELDVEVED